ncbi:MAG TPA: GIY-YIG nuclease family protein [Candidatus Sulfotelmatobacter sp.]|nr:GIY-YIG nuclease family protein [Candidatus Sulfotelmatobacter sp.]
MLEEKESQIGRDTAHHVTSITDQPVVHGHPRRMPKIYYVYILASQRRVLYIGMTSGIEHRVFQHKTHAFPGFTAKYNATNLVYFERYGSVMSAIRREKEMKALRREEKIKLIESTNRKWRDLSYGWYQRHQFQPDAKRPHPNVILESNVMSS